MADTVQIGVDDSCQGLDAPDGRSFPVRDGIATLPADEAGRFLASGAPNIHRHRPVGLGWSRRREAAYERIFGNKEQ